MRRIITNCSLVDGDGIRENMALVLENGVVAAVLPTSQLPCSGDAVLTDAGGNYVSAGFIDMHLHGGGGHDFMDGTPEAYLGAARSSARYGATSIVPTTLTCSDEELFAFFEVFRQAKKASGGGANLLGIHLEGPYFNPGQAGAQDPKYLLNPTPEHYMKILDATDDIIRWSAAPELPGAVEMGRVLSDKGILMSIAHTNATYEEAMKAIEYGGYRHVTHLYSAMSSVTRRNAFRHAGVVEAAYMSDDVTVEIIADGIHLPSSLLQFVMRFKGADATALCTDSMRGAGMPEGEYKLGSLRDGQTVIVEDGVAKLMDRSAFAGSVATCDRLVRNMVNLAGCTLPEAVKMMTSTPARILGVDSRKGALRPGMDADIVIFDGNVNILETIITGETVYERVQ